MHKCNGCGVELDPSVGGFTVLEKNAGYFCKACWNKELPRSQPDQAALSAELANQSMLTQALVSAVKQSHGLLSDSGGRFKKTATIQEARKVARGALADNGLSLRCAETSIAAGGVGFMLKRRFVLSHVSGASEDHFQEILFQEEKGLTLAQAQGKAISYGDKYKLIGLLQLPVVDERDDDARHVPQAAYPDTHDHPPSPHLTPEQLDSDWLNRCPVLEDYTGVTYEEALNSLERDLRAFTTAARDDLTQEQAKQCRDRAAESWRVAKALNEDPPEEPTAPPERHPEPGDGCTKPQRDTIRLHMEDLGNPAGKGRLPHAWLRSVAQHMDNPRELKSLGDLTVMEAAHVIAALQREKNARGDES